EPRRRRLPVRNGSVAGLVRHRTTVELVVALLSFTHRALSRTAITGSLHGTVVLLTERSLERTCALGTRGGPHKGEHDDHRDHGDHDPNPSIHLSSSRC